MALVNGATDINSFEFFFSKTLKGKKNGYGPLKNKGERSKAI